MDELFKDDLKLAVETLDAILADGNQGELLITLHQTAKALEKLEAAHEKNIEKYIYRIEWSEEDRAHIARCLEFPSLSAHGNTIAESLKEIEFVVAESIKWIEKDGEPIPEPFGLKKFKGNLDPTGAARKTPRAGYKISRGRGLCESIYFVKTLRRRAR